MDEMSNEFIRAAVLEAAKQTSSVALSALKMLVDGDHVGLKDLLPYLFEEERR